MSEPRLRREDLRHHPGHVFVARGEPALTRALLARGALRVFDERKGKLVQVGVFACDDAIAAARAEVAATADARAASRERSRERRERLEARYQADFDQAVRRLFPSIPERDRLAIVARACEVGSRRVGRCAAAKALDPEPIRLAVRAWIRHAHTEYDALLDRAGAGRPFGRASKEARRAARQTIRATVDRVAAAWAAPSSSSLPAAPPAPPPPRPAADRPPAARPPAPTPAAAPLFARGLVRRRG
ncbi:MAG: DUF2293 domain-containing protein [Planctomycetes bacterium]|nr:DUF2293 domain-containing protein [Planctomycetota bacterium]